MIAEDKIKTAQDCIIRYSIQSPKNWGICIIKTYFLASERDSHKGLALKSSPEHLKSLPRRPEKLLEVLT